MTAAIPEDICPLCGKSNACGAHQTGRCWCCDTTIPPGLLALVPPQSQRKACICQACVNAYKNDPEVFRAASQ